MDIEKQIRQIAAKKIKVIITGKTRNRDGFMACVDGTEDTHHPTRKEALASILARVRCSRDFVVLLKPVKVTPNPKHKADVPWKRKVL
jgi:hypothetical protein